ncbi:putative 1-aminocyclopropane-1-carboxylate deaminase [Burkholderia pseudomallei MSHR5608]|nr:putative 1-aminocyclopropane-1-carboxylate deaminase [Burkholderia pseudomallei MSHR5608]
MSRAARANATARADARSAPRPVRAARPARIRRFDASDRIAFLRWPVGRQPPEAVRCAFALLARGTRAVTKRQRDEATMRRSDKATKRQGDEAMR